MAEEYKSMVEDAKSELIRLLDGEEGWTMVKTHGKEKEVIVESRPSDTHNCTVYRSTVIIDASVQAVEDTFPLCPYSTHKEWAPDIADILLLESMEDGIIIFQTKTHSVARIISPRSFVCVGKADKEKAPFIHYAVSIDYKKPVDEAGMVRGVYGPFGVKIEPNPSNPKQTRAVVVIQIDFKGKVPRKLVDSSIPSSMINSHNAYKKYLSEKGLCNSVKQ